jgi:PST family polysaccharide transporter
MAYALLPFIVFIIVGGSDLVEVLFGPDWRSSGPLAQILAVGGVFQIFGYVNYWLFTRKGRLGLLWAIEAAAWVPIAVLYFVVSGRGAEWVATLYAVSLLLNWLLSTTVGLRRLGLPAMEFLRPSLRRLGLLIPVVGAGLGVSEVLARNHWHAGPTLAVASLSSLLVVALLALTPTFRSELREFLQIFAKVRRRNA